MNLIHMPGGLMLAFGIYVVLFGAVALAWGFMRLVDILGDAISLSRDEDDEEY